MNRVLPAYKTHSLAKKLPSRTMEADCLGLIPERRIVTGFDMSIFYRKIFEGDGSAVFAKSQHGPVFCVLMKCLTVFRTQGAIYGISRLTFNYKRVRQIVKNAFMFQPFMFAVSQQNVNALV